MLPESAYSPISALTLAIDAATLRHRAIASNIANAGTAGYVPRHLNFEAQFVRTLSGRAAASATAPATLFLRVGEDDRSASDAGMREGVRLDHEMAAMSSNVVHYQSLLKGLSRYLSVLSSAASDGKR